MSELKTSGMMGMYEMEKAVLFLFEKARDLDVAFCDVRFNTRDCRKLDDDVADGMWNLAAYGWLMPDLTTGSAHNYLKPSDEFVKRVKKHTLP